jgi:predicted metal-dependent phosphoesterase TrpH
MIDLHTHSNKSDGTDNPGDLIKLAKSEGLKAIALTDHDTLEGLEEARISAIEEGIIFIPGVEISTQFPGGELHILGLNISDTNGALNNAVKNLKEKRHQRNKKMVKKMRDSGINVSYDDILQIAGGDAIGRPHFARFLLNTGVISSIKEAFQLYLGDGKKFYEPRELMKDEEAISLIHQAGGKAVIAHPGSLKLN